jgi:hypothetical protein
MRTPWWKHALVVFMAGVAVAAVRGQEHDEAWVKRQVEAIRRSDTTGWARIPWVASLTTARQISAKEKQPVFLFTLDGNMETGRC